MINSIGLPNKGLEGFLEQDLPELSRLPVPLIVSVMGTSHEDFRRLVEGVADRPEVAGLELNVSCPNVESGLIVGQQPDETRALLEAVRPLTSKPLIVKLTPNVAEPETVAAAAQAGGADAVSLINTLEASAVDPGTLQPWLGGPGGGLSGAAIRVHALAQVRRVAGGVSIPVIGMGGIESGADALAFLVAGAAAIAVGTANFRDPMAGSRIRAELSDAVATAAARRGFGAQRQDRRRRPQPKVEANLRRKGPIALFGPAKRVYDRRRPMAPSVDTATAVPERTHEQRMRALNRANEIRSKRAQLKRDLKAGKAKVESLLLDPPDYVMSAKAFDMILAVPKYGRVKANKILDPVPHLAVEDDRRPLAAPARRAGRTAAAIAARHRPVTRLPDPDRCHRGTGSPHRRRAGSSARIRRGMPKVFVITGPSGSAKGR